MFALGQRQGSLNRYNNGEGKRYEAHSSTPYHQNDHGLSGREPWLDYRGPSNFGHGGRVSHIYLSAPDFNF